MSIISKFLKLILLLSVLLMLTAVSYANPSEKEVLSAMKKATDFMMNKVSYRGGHVWYVSSDLTERWGEMPARPTQIWTQGGTPDVGLLLLEAYNATGDEQYLRYAEKAANALIYGQHPLGGWHYVIDFDMDGIEQWYRDVASRFKWGYEEYRHYYGNCTFDDEATQGPTRFLLRLYMTTLDPKYREPLLKALDFVLMAQYPDGGWPQRYPLRYEFAHDGLADYTSYYTLNDRVICNNIDLLFEAYESLGREEYRKAALRGIDFLLITQGSEGQAGWAEQYDMDLQPAWGRTHEYPSYMTSLTERVILDLEKYYLMTGDRRYLKPIPGAIAWLERCTFEVLGDGRSRMPRFLTIGDNKPVYRFNTDKVTKEGYGIYRWSFDDSTGVHPFYFHTADIGTLKRDYEHISSLTPEEVLAQYEAKKAKPAVSDVDPSKVAELIESLDDRGAWVEDRYALDTSVSMKMISDQGTKLIKAIITRSFIRNMTTLINYLEQIRK